MLGKLNLRTMTGLAAALVIAGLSGPAANASHTPEEPCTAESEQFIRDYCTAYWQASWQPNFASHAACVQYYMPACHNVYYYDAPEPSSPALGRID